MPCISVIVPTYNVLPYLDRSMTSLLGRPTGTLISFSSTMVPPTAAPPAATPMPGRTRAFGSSTSPTAASVQPATPGWTMQSAILSPSLTRMTTPTPTCWNGF